MSGGTATARLHERRRLLETLAGKDQDWLRRCAAEAARNTGPMLVLGPEDAEALAADPWAPSWSFPDGSRGKATTSAAESMGGLARLLAAGGNDAEPLRQALAHTERACLTFPAGTATGWPAAVAGDTGTPLRTALDRLVTDFPDAPGLGSVALLLLEIADRRPGTVTTTEVPVLFDERPRGGSGTLRLTLLESGPPGLHPDPACMGFLTTDVSFSQALVAAWEASPFRGSDRCVAWSLRTVEDPVRRVAGGSLAAATAVALDDLAPGPVPRLRLRRTTLDPSCAITAGLEGHLLTEVAGYENKLAAAAAAGLRVVVARPAVAEAAPAATKAGVPLRGAGDVGEAVRAARSRINGRFLAAVAAALAVVVVAATFWVLDTRNDRALAQEQTQRLAGALRALADESTDPREAALAALAGYRLDPTTPSVSAMAAVAAEHATTVASTVASEYAISDVVSDGDLVITADDDGEIAAWRLPGLTPLWRGSEDQRATDLALDTEDGVLAAEHGGTVTLYSAEEDGLDRIADLSSTEIAGQFSAGLRWAQDRDGRQVLYTFSNDGFVTAFSSDGVLLDGWRLDYRDDPATGLMGPLSVEALSEAGYDSGGESFWLSTSRNDVFRWTPSGYADLPLQRVLTDDALPGEVLSITRMNGGLALGTDRGIVVQRSYDAQLVTPYGGVAERVTGLAYTARGGLYAVTGSGTAFVPDSPEFGGTQLNTRFQSGRVTALAALDRPDAALVTGYDSSSIAVFDPDSATGGLPGAPPSNVLQFTGAGDLLVGDGGGSNQVSRLRTLDVGTGTETEAGGYATVQTYEFRPWFGRYAPFVNAAAATDEFVVAVGMSSEDTGFLSVWDTATGEPLEHLPFTGAGDSLDLPDIVNLVALNPVGDTVIATNVRSGELAIWSTTDWGERARVRLGRPGSLSLSPDGTALALAVLPYEAEAGAITVIDPTTAEVRQRRELPGARRAEYDPTGRYLAVLTDRQRLTLLDAATLEEVRTVDLRDDADELAWRPDGAAIAVGKENSGTVVLDAQTLDAVSPPLRSASDFPVGELAWTPDGSILAVTLAARADGRNMPSETALWTPTPEAWERQLCAVAGSGLTAEEWRRLAGDTDVPRPEVCP